MAARFNIVAVDIAKLRYYCLSESHYRGRHKARVFRSRLGLTAGDAQFLRRALLAAARNNTEKLRPMESDLYGQRYALDFPLATDVGRAVIRSLWIVLSGDDVLRLSTCYVL